MSNPFVHLDYMPRDASIIQGLFATKRLPNQCGITIIGWLLLPPPAFCY